MKNDPSQFRKQPEQCFLGPDLKNVWEFRKKKNIWHNFYPQNDN